MTESLDAVLIRLSHELKAIANDWSEPSLGRTVNRSAVVGAISVLRTIADEANVAVVVDMAKMRKS